MDAAGGDQVVATEEAELRQVLESVTMTVYVPGLLTMIRDVVAYVHQP